jgi:hypothetical protein
MDQTYGAASAVTGGYLRGSGTSQATGRLRRNRARPPAAPTWANNQVKALLTGTTTKLKVGPQPDTAQGKSTFNSSMKQGGLGD